MSVVAGMARLITALHWIITLATAGTLCLGLFYAKWDLYRVIISTVVLALVMASPYLLNSRESENAGKRLSEHPVLYTILNAWVLSMVCSGIASYPISSRGFIDHFLIFSAIGMVPALVIHLLLRLLAWINEGFRQ